VRHTTGCGHSGDPQACNFAGAMCFFRPRRSHHQAKRLSGRGTPSPEGIAARTVGVPRRPELRRRTAISGIVGPWDAAMLFQDRPRSWKLRPYGLHRSAMQGIRLPRSLRLGRGGDVPIRPQPGRTVGATRRVALGSE